MTKVTLDFETQSEFDLKKGGAYEYSRHPSTRALCLAIGFNGKTKILTFEEVQKRFVELPESLRIWWNRCIQFDNIIFAAHNAYFEQCIYQNVLVRRLGWPPIPIHKWRCTAAKAAAMAIPRNLGDAGAVMKTATQKDYEGYKVMMKLCKPTAAWAKWKKKNGEGPEPEKFWTPKTAPEDFRALYKYCKIDVQSEVLLDEALPDLTPFEQKVWFLDQKMNLRGIQVDLDLVNKVSGIMEKESKTMAKELDTLTMGLVGSGNARNAILEFLQLEGLELPDLRAKTVQDYIENGKVSGDAKKILEIRKALSKASTAKYKMFLLRAGRDGRARDFLLYCGAQRTGRWAGKGLQPQNFPRGVIKNIYEAIARIKKESAEDLKLLYGENLMPLFSSVLRGVFTASPGHEMFVQDYNAIECRVAWWLAGHQKGLELFRKGVDPYWEMAKEIYGLPAGLIYNGDDEKHAEMRQVGKAAVLGCGYQMGPKKFVSAAWDVYRAKVDADMAKIAVQTYRKIHFPVTEIWDSYQNAAIQATKNPGDIYEVGKVKFYREGRFLFIELPSGRRLSYCDPEINMGKTWVMEKGKDRIYASNIEAGKMAHKDGYKVVNEFQSERLSYFEINQLAKKSDTIIPKWAKETTYGGKIFENVVQSVSRDILAESIVRVEKMGFNVLMHSHDELVSEAPKGKFTSGAYRKTMEQLPKWAKGLPLKAGGWVGPRYKKG